MTALGKSSGMYICIWDIEQEGSRVITIKTTAVVAKKKKPVRRSHRLEFFPIKMLGRRSSDPHKPARISSPFQP